MNTFLLDDYKKFTRIKVKQSPNAGIMSSEGSERNCLQCVLPYFLIGALLAVIAEGLINCKRDRKICELKRKLVERCPTCRPCAPGYRRMGEQCVHENEKLTEVNVPLDGGGMCPPGMIWTGSDTLYPSCICPPGFQKVGSECISERRLSGL